MISPIADRRFECSLEHPTCVLRFDRPQKYPPLPPVAEVVDPAVNEDVPPSPAELLPLAPTTTVYEDAGVTEMLFLYANPPPPPLRP